MVQILSNIDLWGLCHPQACPPEAAGVVAAVGPGVRHVKEGDQVICQPSGYCGLCEHCRAGNTHYCEKAFTTGGDGPADVRPGAFAEYVKTDAGSCRLVSHHCHAEHKRSFDILHIYKKPANMNVFLSYKAGK